MKVDTSQCKYIFMAPNYDQKLSIDELADLNKQFDQQLKDLQSDHSENKSASGSSNILSKLLLYAGVLLVGLLAPFVLLIRTSIYMYSQYQFNGWFALVIGLGATIFLLLGYALFINIRFSQRWRVHKYIRRGVAILVAAFMLYGLLYYSEMNTKTDEVRSHYRSLHPIMRVALSTVTLADTDLVVTDIYRTSDDYAQMGLPENQQSLHFVQKNGYVHAIDLRTKGRAEWKNWMLSSSLNIVGLQTLRHTGTADHLHVYLPLND